MKPVGFGERFLLPLCAGGALHVGAPIGRAGLDKLRETKLEARVVAEIFAARSAVASELLYDPIPPALDLEALRLGVALHDLLFLFHPSAVGLREKKLAEVASWAASLARLPPSLDADTLVARHSMLHLLPDLGRMDVMVSFWVGRREFHGQEPPKRLTAWPSVRRVREDRRRVGCFIEAASHPLAAETVRALFDASPLTDLLHPVRIEPRLELGRHRKVLSRPELCRLVVYAWLEQGIDKVGGALAQATLAELDGSFSETARFVCALLAHVHLCALFGNGNGSAGASPNTSQGDVKRDRRAPLVPRIPVGADLSLRDFYGLFAALHRTTPELSAPADVRRDPQLSKRVNEHALACATACGATRTSELSTLIARAGGPIELVSADPA